MSKRCRALYSYTKQHTNEISFAQGDIIEDVVEHEDGWWSGMVHGQLGVFPYTYVEALQSNELTVRACYDYEAKSPNELSIKKGDIFIVNEKDTEGKWWHGVFTQPTLRKGWFPAQYVQEIDSSEALEPAAEETTTTTTTFQPPLPQQPQQPRQPQPPQQPRQPQPPQQPQQPRQPQPPQQPQQPQPPQASSKPMIPQQPQQIPMRPFVPDHASSDDGQKVVDNKETPPPMKPVKAEKAAKGTQGHVELQVHGAQGLPDAKAAYVVVSVKEGDKGKLRKAFKTETAKKGANPFWMEAFQVNIMDPEDAELVVQVMDGKKSLGEVQIPLRSTKRAPLEAFGGLDKSFPLTSGTLHLIISYRDINAPSKPKFFKKDESIVMSTSAEGFDLSNAGKHWVQKFHDAGLEIAAGDIPQQEPPPPPQNKPVVPQLQKPPPPQNKPVMPQLQPQQPQPPQPPKPAPVPTHFPQPPKPAPPATKPAIPTHHPVPPVSPKGPPAIGVKPPPPQVKPQPQQPQPPKPAPVPAHYPQPPKPAPPAGGYGQPKPPPQLHQPPAKPMPPPQIKFGAGVAPPSFNPSPRTTVTPLPVQGASRQPPSGLARPQPPPVSYDSAPSTNYGNDQYYDNSNDTNNYGSNDQYYDNSNDTNNYGNNDQYYDNNSGYGDDAPPPLPARDDL